MEILLVRHGEALKNLEDRAGGPGTPLTDAGRRQIREVPAAVAQLTAERPAVVYYCERAQVEESAAILAEAWGAARVADERLAPLHLGVLDGLSPEAASERDAEAASALDAWRRGARPLDEVSIPAAESFWAFLERVQSFLRDRQRQHRGELVCAVSTRSTLIMLKNVLLNDVRTFPRGYRAYAIPHGLEGLYACLGAGGES